MHLLLVPRRQQLLRGEREGLAAGGHFRKESERKACSPQPLEPWSPARRAPQGCRLPGALLGSRG